MGVKILHLLKKSELAGGVEIHKDILSVIPTALSRKRAQRLGKPNQEPMEDNFGGNENKGGPDNCRLCNPEYLHGHPTLEHKVDRCVASFSNTAPYMPYDQKVMHLWHDNLETRKKKFACIQISGFKSRRTLLSFKSCS